LDDDDREKEKGKGRRKQTPDPGDSRSYAQAALPSLGARRPADVASRSLRRLPASLPALRRPCNAFVQPRHSWQ